MNDYADFNTHRIEGFARMGGQFSVPLFSHIVDNLWVGGCPRGHLPDHFKSVICLYPWETYEVPDETVYVRAYLYDSHDEPDEKQIKALATVANVFRRMGPTLVHCQAGLNRSNLVAAMALMLDGMRAPDAIRLLREKRCDMVLCNRTFESWLERQEVA